MGQRDLDGHRLRCEFIAQAVALPNVVHSWVTMRRGAGLDGAAE